MATAVSKTFMGLKAVWLGTPAEDGGASTTFTQIPQPGQGGVTINGTKPTRNKQYRENERFPAVTTADQASGGYEVTFPMIDFDDAILKRFFGEKAVGGIPIEGFSSIQTLRLDMETGYSIIIPRLQFDAVLNGVAGSSEALKFEVSGEVLAPKEGEMAISFPTTPAASPAMAPMSSKGSL